MVSDNTPIIVGVGQFTDRLDSADYAALSPADIAARACEAAIADAGGALRDSITIVGGIRTFEDSTPMPAPFGKSAKYPLAVARRLGIRPELAILEKAGGQSPLTLIADLGERLRDGKAVAALAFGSEAISTLRHLRGKGEMRDWAEQDEGAVEDHGRGLEGLVTRYARQHGVVGAPAGYALLENARRARLGLSREDYIRQIGELFAPFTHIAASNRYSAAEMEAMSADEIATAGERNRMIADPYRLKMVSRDQVNQGAAILLTTVATARLAGVPEDKWMYVHGASLLSEPELLSRMDPGRYTAARISLDAALAQAGKTVDDMAAFDFYSCFPTAVFGAAIDALGLSPQDPRGLTVTGGLPFFGGPGNNYSMHAIASMTQRMRARPGSYGLVGLNGGIQSKYGTVILSTDPVEWPGCRRDDLQEVYDEAPRPMVVRHARGWGRIVTYTVIYAKGAPTLGVIIGELESGGRFLANHVDDGVLDRMATDDVLGARIYVDNRDGKNRFAFDRETVRAALSPVKAAFRDHYDHVLVRRDGHILVVTINRPDARNSLPTAAHHELASIFDAYEADPDLWVAILTGAGDKAFCAGADLKSAGSGDTMPDSGFAGLSSRSKTKPVIAAVNGIAMGGGFETALACDMVVADPGASFSLSEVRVGLIAGAGGAVRLPRQIPRKIAFELLLTGRRIDVRRAAALGFVNQISEPGQALETAHALATEIVSVSPTSVRLTMQIVREAEAYADADEAARQGLASTAIDDLMVSEDLIEGTTAFAQKRVPQWKNR